MNELEFHEKCEFALKKLGYRQDEAREVLIEYRNLFRHFYLVYKKKLEKIRKSKFGTILMEKSIEREYVEKFVGSFLVFDSQEKGVYASKSRKR